MMNEDYIPTSQDMYTQLDALNQIRRDVGSDSIFLELCEEVLYGSEEEDLH